MYPSCTKVLQYLTAPERTNNLLWRYGQRLIYRGSVAATNLKDFGPHGKFLVVDNFTIHLSNTWAYLP